MTRLEDIRGRSPTVRAGRTARGRNLHDTERHDRLCSTCMTLCRRQRGTPREPGKSEGWKGGRRDEGGRVTTRSSYQRLFCGFDPHWLANDGQLPHPSSFRKVFTILVVVPVLPFAHQNPTLDPLFLPQRTPSSNSPARVFHPHSCLVYFQGFLILR